MFIRILISIRISTNKAIRVSQSKNSDEYGLYFYDNTEREVLFFGIWYEFWEEHGKPICYCVSEKSSPPKIVEQFTRLHEGKLISFDKWYTHGIEEDLLSKDNSEEQIARLIEIELNQLVQS